MQNLILTMEKPILGLKPVPGRSVIDIELANRALFGKGEETIVDTSGQCTWQLSPLQFTTGNADWEESI